ncbi:MAG TPA: hypothetical protein PLA74_02745 [Syntrophales bacterium]|nr:hypothetical protein [Syntrophales bacterium]HPQ43501.1 hypothetical protein [Syntrophales bacterium]
MDRFARYLGGKTVVAWFARVLEPVSGFSGLVSGAFLREVMHMILKIVLIFAAGFIVDLLVTRYTRAIAERKRTRATVLSGMITIANFVLLTIILKDNATSGIFNIIAFAGGNSLGTFCAMKRA